MDNGTTPHRHALPHGFTHLGKYFDLSPDQITPRFACETASTVEKHWVEIDGVRWPVNQALRIAIGAQEPPIRSSSARRYFHQAGYVIGALATGAPPRRTVQTPPMLDLSDLPRLDDVAAAVSFTWGHAGSISLDSKGLPLFPALPDSPGLYRFDFGLNESGIRRLYIGESKALLSRARQYRNAKADGGRPKRTSRRVHKILVEHLGEGHGIEFAIATEVRVDGLAASLARKSARLLAESAAVLAGQLDARMMILNIDAEPLLPDDDK